ncbi:MAG: GTPase HflX [Ruminococcus sp.]|nr:GTPase HflX [Ruminococcus sp.]
MFVNEEKIPKALLVSVDTGEFDNEISMKELEELTKTANAEVVATVIQKRPSFEKATCVGQGRLLEIADICKQLEVDLIIFDHELTATQVRNIEEVTNVRTIDRTTLILDIFAQRARTKEGKLQVELAQQRYRLPRLAGMGVTLSRLGGGIGTRGPGETKLETDKRHIRSRISALEEELKELKKHREFSRKRRKKDNLLCVAIVGYTNAGKSTLINALTDSDIFAEDKLFATLDTTSRGLTLPDGRKILIIDTVGLIRRLPHHLVEAFKSTLEEASSSDLILNVVDVSSSEFEEHLEVTNNLLGELGCNDIPKITVFNKCDRCNYCNALSTDSTHVKISAKKKLGFEELLNAIAQNLPETSRRIRALLPYDKSSLINKIRLDGKVFSEEYQADGTLIDALVDIKIFHEVEPFIL